MLSTLTSPFASKERKQGAGLQLATEVLNDLEHYSRLPVPKMPSPLCDMTEQDIIDKVMKTAGNPRASQNDKDQVQLFALWRAALFAVESKNAGRVEVLYYAARVFESVIPEYPAHAADLDALDIFMRTDWGSSIRPVLSWADARKRGPQLACDLIACPSYLRTMSDTAQVPKARRRGGEPTKLQGAWMQQGFTQEVDQ